MLLELEPIIDPAVNARAIAIAAAIRDQRLAGVRDVIPTYRSVAVHFDPLTCDIDSLRDAMREAGAAPPLSASRSLVGLPPPYGGGDRPGFGDVGGVFKTTARDGLLSAP